MDSFFFLVLSRMDSLCPARFLSPPLSISHTAPIRLPPLHTHLVSLHRSHRSTASHRLPLLSLSHRKVDSHSHLFYFIVLFIHIFRSLSRPRPSGLLRGRFIPFLPAMTLPIAHTFGFLAHCLISPSSCCNNNSPTHHRLSSYNRTPCLEPSGFL
jgi:hypothetical protein